MLHNEPILFIVFCFVFLALRFILQRNVRIADWIYCNSTAEDDIGDTEESFRGYLKEKIETDEIVSCLYSPLLNANEQLCSPAAAF